MFCITIFNNSKVQVMIISLFCAFCIHVVALRESSVTRNRETRTSSDIFRQMLNQETIIRLSLTKTIEDMRKDMLKQKQITASLEKKVEKLKTESALLRQDNTLLKEELSQHRSTFSTLNNTVQILNGNLENIRENVSHITNNQGEMNSAMKEVTKNITQNRNHQLKLSSEISALKLFRSNVSSNISDIVTSAMKDMNINILQTQNQQLKLSNDIAALKLFRMNVSSYIKEPRGKVGFTAGITSASSSWSGSTLVFPKLIYSVGGGYSTSTGVFTSPTAGLFAFYVAVQSYGTKYITLQITLNSAGKVNCLGFNGNYAAASNLAVLHLEKGDRVYVQRYSGTGYHTHPAPLTTFSGFML